MKNDEKISIIIPVFNVEKYLRKCIDSILSQTYKNLEIILVNDGSTDNSAIICDNYQKKDSRIKVIHKKNGGLSDARNCGIKASTGNYITFIDSDDFIDKNFITILYKLILENNADIVISRIVDVFENSKNIKPSINNESYIISKEECYKKMLLQDEIDVSACGKLYKKHIFKDIKFPIKELYEDLKTIDKIIEKSTKIVFTRYAGYYYLQREGSIMNSGFNPKKLSLIDATERLVKFIKTKYPNVVDAATKRYVYNNYHILGKTIFYKNLYDINRQIRKNILNHTEDILLKKIYTFKEKVATIILIIGLKPYKTFWKVFCKMKGKKWVQSDEKNENT